VRARLLRAFSCSSSSTASPRLRRGGRATGSARGSSAKHASILLRMAGSCSFLMSWLSTSLVPLRFKLPAPAGIACCGVVSDAALRPVPLYLGYCKTAYLYRSAGGLRVMPCSLRAHWRTYGDVNLTAPAARGEAYRRRRAEAWKDWFDAG